VPILKILKISFLGALMRILYIFQTAIIWTTLVFLLIFLSPAFSSTLEEAAAAVDAGSPAQAGFPAAVSGDVYDQIKAADLDGDGKKELIFGATDGSIHVLNYNGTERRTGFWPKHTSGPIMAGVETGDIDGDGQEEIIAASFDGKVYALSASGCTKWEVNTRSSITFSRPSLGDIDGDGNLDVLVGSSSKKLFAIGAQGHLLWEHSASDKISGTPVIADINGDDKMETVFKADNGYVSVVESNGGTMSGWPRQAGNQNGFFPFVPAAADIDEDGIKEIIVGTPDSNQILVYNAKGDVIKKITLNGAVHDSPVITDIDRDGSPDMIVSDDKGFLNVINLSKSLAESDDRARQFPGWPQKKGDHLFGSPRVSDIDGDGNLDIIFTAWNSSKTGEQAGTVNAVSLDGSDIKGFPKYIGKSYGKITISDLDNDGDLELIVAGGIGLTAKQIHVYDCPGRVVLKMALLGVQYGN
jgi:hypothetical protein